MLKHAFPMAAIAAILALACMFAAGCTGGQASQQAADASSQEQPSEQAEQAEAEQAEAEQAEVGQGGVAATPQMPTDAPADTTGGSPWIDSNIPGNVTAATSTSPVDDFYLYANHDWLVSAEIEDGANVAGTSMEAEGYELARNAVADADLSGHDARQAQLLYRAAADVGARNASGCEPARSTVETIRSLQSIDDVSAFLLDVDGSAGVPTIFYVHNKADEEGSKYVTRIELSPTTFGSSMGTVGMDATTVEPESKLYQTRLELASAVLTGVGFSPDEAKAAFENRIELEKRIIEIAEQDENVGDDAEEAKLTLAKLDEASGAFPLRALVESRGYADAADFDLQDEASLRAAATLYTQDNIELIRDYLICGYALEVGSWLDEQTYKAWLADYGALGYYDQITVTDPSDAEAVAFCLTAQALPTPVGRAFVEGCDLGKSKEFVEKLCAEAIETHEGIINESKWLSDASKERLVAKLEAMTVQAVYPDVWEDYSGLNLEGLGYYDARRAIWLNNVERNAALTGGKVDPGLWSDPSLIGSTARYDVGSNSFRIAAGITEPHVNRYLAGDIALPELLGGGVGYAVFHETAHVFDAQSIYHDAEGRESDDSILDAADLEEFQKRVQNLSDYYDTITVWTGQQVIGQVCTNEGLAEICGMRARLAYAAGKEGFDYKAFFEKRAKLTCALRTPLFELQCLYGADPHPLTYLDTNVTVQQFDEFYAAYDVEEGDAMYLAPEERVALW